MADDPWSVDLLDRMRREGDPLADSTVKAVFDKGTVARGERAVDQARAQRRHSRRPLAASAGRVPSGERTAAELGGPCADPDAGESVFLRYGLTSFGILACASLPECYVLRDVAAVLGTTQRLDAHARRRIFETAMMVLSVMAEGGLAPGGSGIRIVQKVRLMHAAVRHLILTPPPAAAAGPPQSLADTLLAQRWPAERGTPLSQEDLAAVLLTFSYVMVRSWKHLGITLSPEEARAYLHCWNVVGHVLGIRDELLAHDLDDAARLFDAIKRTRAADTPDGRALTAAVIGVSESFAGPFRILLRPIPRILMRGLLQAETCAMLARAEARPLAHPRIGRSCEGWRVSSTGRPADAFQNLPDTARLSALISYRLLEDIVTLPRGGQRTAFHIPEKLARSWGVVTPLILTPPVVCGAPLRAAGSRQAPVRW